jgi:hypothetical protein
MSGEAERSAVAGTRSLRAWLRVDHRHAPATTGVVLLFAALHAWYASWLAADLRLGTVAFVVVGVCSAYGLYRQPNRRSVVVVGLYVLAALLVASPVFMNLPFVLSAAAYGVSNPLAFTLGLADLLFLLVFGLLATVPALLAWRLSRG